MKKYKKNTELLPEQIVTKLKDVIEGRTPTVVLSQKEVYTIVKTLKTAVFEMYDERVQAQRKETEGYFNNFMSNFVFPKKNKK